MGNALFGLQTMENENNHLVDECFELFAELLGRMEGATPVFRKVVPSKL